MVVPLREQSATFSTGRGLSAHLHNTSERESGVMKVDQISDSDYLDFSNQDIPSRLYLNKAGRNPILAATNLSAKGRIQVAGSRSATAKKINSPYLVPWQISPLIPLSSPLPIPFLLRPRSFYPVSTNCMRSTNLSNLSNRLYLSSLPQYP